MTIGEQITALLKREGGYSSDPTDRGGETNLGITWPTLKAAIKRGLVPPDTTIATLTTPQAHIIYETFYLIDPGISKLPRVLHPLMLDYGVNSGPAIAIKALQRVMGIKDDGVIGEMTLNKVATFNPNDLVKGVAKERARMIVRIVQNDLKRKLGEREFNKLQAKFLGGWVERVLDFL